MTGSSTSLPLVLCLPGAGSAAAKFERLSRLMPDLDIRTCELPGRGLRMAESNHTALAAHVDHYVEYVEAHPYNRWVLLGESLGALVATKVAESLSGEPTADILGLVAVSSSPMTTGRRDPDEVLELLNREMTRQAAGALPGDWWQKAVRADLTAARASGVRELPTLTVPIAAIRGDQDAMVCTEEAQAWAARTTGPFHLAEVPGQHLLFEKPTTPAIGAVRSAIEFVLAKGTT